MVVGCLAKGPRKRGGEGYDNADDDDESDARMRSERRGIARAILARLN